MPECVRCGDFTDNDPRGEYYYCADCLDTFAEIEQSGVIVEQDEAGGDYHIIVTDHGASVDGGTELSQTEALARAKHISDEEEVSALFKYDRTGSRWILDEYLQAHPEIRQDVHDRLRRVPEKADDGIFAKIRNLF